MRPNLKLAAGCVAGVVVLFPHDASFASPAPPPPTTAGALAVIDIFQRIEGVTRQLCTQPELFGSTRSAEGTLSGQIALAMLSKAFADAKIGVGVRAGISDWRGVRQQDLAGALNASNGCGERVFTLMVERLSLTDYGTGRLVPRPKNPGATYRTVAVRAVTPQPTPPSQAASGEGNVQTLINGSGNTVTVAPPTTDQQKAQALEGLKAEIGELADFPNRPMVTGKRSLLETIFVRTDYIHLYDILARYYRATKRAAPMADALVTYEKKYYDFEESETVFEENTSFEIGKIVEVRYPAGWYIYLRYFELRSVGFTKQQVVDAGNFLNYSITWEDAERVNDLLSKNPAVGPIMKRQIEANVALQNETTRILATYKSQ